jgi:glycosyltransferase involved in cell wall biosynthesis
MKKIAFVNQRYGLEVNGGSELYTRQIAEKLTEKFDVSVITTKALDYTTWANHYQSDVETINGITVYRFPVVRNRTNDFGEFTNHVLSHPQKRTEDIERKWFEDQGPCAPKLLEFIEQKEAEFDVFVFVTYLYYPSVFGIPLVARKSIFIPTAHDEPYIYFNLYRKLFSLPQFFVFLTEEERHFVHQVFHNETIPHRVMGVGVDVPKTTSPLAFRTKYQIQGDYLVYAGRIDTGKNCHEMIQDFQTYLVDHPTAQLVLVGKAAMEVPRHPRIHLLGFVSDEDKFNAIAGAKILVLPSAFESLSIAVLEALALGIPILVNAKSEVLRGHAIRSNAGLYYENGEEFQRCIDYMSQHSKIYQIMKKNAIQYIKKYYQWDCIVDGFVQTIELVSQHNR